MDKFDQKIPFGKVAGKTIREFYKENPKSFIATTKINPVEEEKKKIVSLMREYLVFLENVSKMEDDGFEYEPNFGGPELQKQPDFEDEPDFGDEPDFDSDGFSAIKDTNVETHIEYGDSKRYINQIWAFRSSDKTKTIFKTLAVDSKIKLKKMDENTVSPLEIIDELARFHVILITKDKKGAVIRKMGINPKHLKHLTAQYQAIVNMELNIALGAKKPEKKTELLHERYMYMSEGRGGKRNYESIIAYTPGNNYPVYVSITNSIETNGQKTNLGSDHILLSLDDYGSMLGAMNDFLLHFKNEKFLKALNCAKEGGYLDENNFSR